MTSLFESQAPRPLADRLRPLAMDQVVGQGHLLGVDGPIGRQVQAGRLSSMMLWGPPGTGKTTLARIVAGVTGRRFEAVSAVSSGVADIKRFLAEARRALELESRATILFIDEIHRFN
ncbi:MAG: AAA family ATPase, partial [Rhodospirillaceae bacterium]|nr:AAA family ATPase [Rhodospirillaceae bacterium]